MKQYLIAILLGVIGINFIFIAVYFSEKIGKTKVHGLVGEKDKKKVERAVGGFISSLVMMSTCFLLSLILAIVGTIYKMHDENFVKEFTDYQACIEILRNKELPEREKEAINESIARKNEVLSSAQLSYIKDNDNGFRAYPKTVLDLQMIPKI